jgi:methylmalonyl-CoA/ethylmalonyl-CoA epimerase
MADHPTASPGPIAGATLDHAAHAVPAWDLAWPRYAVELGAEWNSGGPGLGFAPAQLRFANGARLELLMPYETGVNDFLARFLAASGPGPHHLTFKVDDLDQALETARRAGFDPVGVDRSDPDWKEAFLHPRQATGVVVQLAQAAGAWSSPPPADYPTRRRQRSDGTGPVAPATLVRATHAVADLDRGLLLFRELLGGSVSGRGASGTEEWVDLAWDGPLALRLVAPVHPGAGEGASTPLAAWLGARPGRLHHVLFRTEEARLVGDAQPVPDGLPGTADLLAAPSPDTAPPSVVEPEDNLGLRLVVIDAGPTPGGGPATGDR